MRGGRIVTKRARDFLGDREAGRVDTIVIGDQNAHYFEIFSAPAI